jgi:EpsD family peptidyl-prolyl cis-trans isomerase
MRRVVCATVMGLLLAGAAAAYAGEAPAAEGADPGRVVAKVNAVDITYAQFKANLSRLERDQRSIPPERYGEILRAMVQQEILAQRAVAAGLDQDPIIVARLEQTRRNILIEEMVKRQIVPQISLTEEDVRKAYESNKALFSVDTVAVRHILVKTQAEAEALLKELEAGKDFAELAKAHSEDAGSKDKGGDLGTISRGQTEGEFEEEAFRLKDGEISTVVKTQYGYHVLKGGPHGSTVKPFADVKDEIRQALLQIRQQEAFQQYLADAEKQATVEIYEDRLR